MKEMQFLWKDISKQLIFVLFEEFPQIWKKNTICFSPILFSEALGRTFTKLDIGDHNWTVKNPIVYGSGRLNMKFHMTDFPATTSLWTLLLTCKPLVGSSPNLT